MVGYISLARRDARQVLWDVATGVGAGPPMLSTPISSAIERHSSREMICVVESWNVRTARRIAGRFSPAAIRGDARISETTSCNECRLSKMIAASGVARR